jgi:hypothetical protein
MMKNNTKYLLIIFLLQFLSTAQAFEKVGATSFQFLKMLTSARAYGLAGSFSSVVNNSEAVFWNPGALTKVSNLDFSVGYLDWFMDAAHYSLSAAYKMDGVGTFGFLALYSTVGPIEETRVEALGFIGDTYNPGLTGRTFTPSASVFGISFARQLTDKFAFGVTAKYAREDLIYASAGELIFDGGLIFNTGFRSIQVSATLINFGPEIKFIEKSYPLPQTLNLGISAYLVSADQYLITDTGDHSLLVTYDMIQPRDYDQQHSMGFEYGFNKMIFLRGGYKFNGDQEDYCFGLGINYQTYRLDYAYSSFGKYLDAVHRITVGLEIR